MDPPPPPDTHTIVPGEPIAIICERIFAYTTANLDGLVVADIATFDTSLQEVLRLLVELPRVERFVAPNFTGTFRVINAGWTIRTALAAVFTTVIRASAPGTQFECPA